MATVSPALLQAYLARRAELVRFFSVRLKSTEFAEDLVQEIYFRIERAELDAIKDPDGYLYRIGWNLMLDQMRQRRRGSARERAWIDAEIVTRAGVAVDPTPSANSTVAARERLRRLEARLSALPPQMQRAFRLHKFDGLSHAETAARLGVSKSAVEKHISAALRKLAEDEL